LTLPPSRSVAAALSTIFRAFQRADSSRSDGLGLGLFIVKQAADLLGHRVEAHSVDGRGSRFAIMHIAVSLRSILEDISAEFSETARLKASPFHPRLALVRLLEQFELFANEIRAAR